MRPFPVGSATSNISAPLNTSSKKEFGFHQQFASSFQTKIVTPAKANKVNNGYSYIQEYEESPFTNKQLQLEEFNINLKQNRIKKYGKNTDVYNTPILNKNLRRRLENVAHNASTFNQMIAQSERKPLKQNSRFDEEYTPSVFDHKNVSLHR